ncbi:MAG: hypothetical protein CUN56_11840 [Phototrophicales bacterium]|nr:MAG: hypothetical protein CUN56_11840 [Phototrophicales bacterium]
MKSLMKRHDWQAIIVLILLWALFFWRILTPNTYDQASFVESDYSGQFVTFGAYQYARFSNGEIPLWNPYNNGGLPFIADTQAAVFYPPRLLTIALSSAWTYASLQVEVALHVLLYTLLMYALIRRMTLGKQYSVLAAFIGAITAGYGGFMTGYPPLQVALLEAAIWLPLVILGILEATRQAVIRWQWIALAGWALGLSWMAGHPQTSWFATYAAVGFLAYRVDFQWRKWLIWTSMLGAVTFGVTAVQLIPGFEYLQLTMRNNFTFDAKGGGFEFNDLTSLIFPRLPFFWSPLYFGAIGFALAVIGLLSKERDRIFWGVVAIVALGLSFGDKSPLFHAAYNILPGMRFFRGQERAVFLFANSTAILTAFGVIALLDSPATFRRWFSGFAAACALIASSIYVLWSSNPDVYNYIINQAVFIAVILGIAAIAIYNLPRWKWALAALIVFELFTVNMDNLNYEPIPASERTFMQPSPLVEYLQAQTGVFRVDGGLETTRIGIPPGGNTGSLYHIADIRGISPLFLDGPHAIIQRALPSEVAWEMFAVRYVFSYLETLPVTSQIVATEGDLKLHELSDPRPYAMMLYDYVVAPGDEFAREYLANPNFNERQTLILAEEPPISIRAGAEGESTWNAAITDYQPEQITIQVSTDENGLLSIAHVDYPGWHITLDGVTVHPIRAYGAVIALPIPAGEHEVILTYAPRSFQIGAGLSLVTWSGLIILGSLTLFRGIGLWRSS